MKFRSSLVRYRGNERRKIFLSQADYKKFLASLTDALHKDGLLLYAFTRIGNHYHLLVETPNVANPLSSNTQSNVVRTVSGFSSTSRLYSIEVFDLSQA